MIYLPPTKTAPRRNVWNSLFLWVLVLCQLKEAEFWHAYTYRYNNCLSLDNFLSVSQNWCSSSFFLNSLNPSIFSEQLACRTPNNILSFLKQDSLGQSVLPAYPLNLIPNHLHLTFSILNGFQVSIRNSAGVSPLAVACVFSQMPCVQFAPSRVCNSWFGARDLSCFSAWPVPPKINVMLSGI